jgi:hypothetical protein
MTEGNSMTKSDRAMKNKARLEAVVGSCGKYEAASVLK